MVDTECYQGEDEEEDYDYYCYYVVFLDHFVGGMCGERRDVGVRRMCGWWMGGWEDMMVRKV